MKYSEARLKKTRVSVHVAIYADDIVLWYVSESSDLRQFMQASKKRSSLYHPVLLPSGSLCHLQKQRRYFATGEVNFVQQV